MKHLFLFCGSTGDEQRFAQLPADVVAKMEQSVYDWISTNGPNLESHGRLAPSRLARAVTQNDLVRLWSRMVPIARAAKSSAGLRSSMFPT